MLKNKANRSSTLALALLLLLTIDSFTTTTAFWPFKKKYTTVQINNWLVSKAGLQVHCKDKHDHDIGSKQLAYLELFSFQFVPPFFMQVDEYSCDFTWNGVLQSFKIYVQTRDQEVCGKFCDWIVVESGPCLHNPENDKYNKCYHWDVKSFRRPITSYPLSGLVNQTDIPTMEVKGGVGHVP